LDFAAGEADLGAVVKVVAALEGTRDDDLEESLKLALAVFDSDQTGAIPATELSHVCRNMGEKLSEEEVNSIMLNAPDDGMGGVDYVAFAKLVSTMAAK
jgi:calmodulin